MASNPQTSSEVVIFFPYTIIREKSCQLHIFSTMNSSEQLCFHFIPIIELINYNLDDAGLSACKVELMIWFGL